MKKKFWLAEMIANHPTTPKGITAWFSLVQAMFSKGGELLTLTGGYCQKVESASEWTLELKKLAHIPSRGLESFSFGESLLCSLQMMQFFWFHRTLTFGKKPAGFQPNMKHVGWESAPPSLKPWFSDKKTMVDCGLSCCPSEDQI